MITHQSHDDILAHAFLQAALQVIPGVIERQEKKSDQNDSHILLKQFDIWE